MATEVCPSNGPFSDLFTLQCRHATHVSRISRYISERNVSIDIVIYLPEKPFSSRLDFLVLITVTEKKNGKLVTDIQWAPDFVKLNQRTVLEAYRINIIIIWNIASLKCICQDTYDQTEPLFFPHDKCFKGKISKSHIKTAYIVFLGRTKNFPHLEV